MARWHRFLIAVFMAFALALGVSPASARPAELGAGAATKAEALAPHDVSPVAQAPIPPLPPGYVTKNFGWLDFSFPEGAEERVAPLLADANTIKAEFARALGQPVLEHVTVRVAPTVADMARLAPADAPPPGYASGVSYNGLHFVLLSMLAPRGGDAVDLDEVFRHELSHVALEDAVGGRHVPVWFNEGLATALSGELAVQRAQVLWNATLSGTLIPLADLDRGMPQDTAKVNLAYAESADFMRHLMRKSDRLRFTAMIERIRDGQPFDRAVAEAYGVELRRLEFEWRGDLERRYSIIPALAGGGLVWLLMMGILVAAYVRRRRRAKAILARWAREEAIEDARIAAQLAAERAAREGSVIANMPSVAKPVTRVEVKVERDGGWYTLH